MPQDAVLTAPQHLDELKGFYLREVHPGQVIDEMFRTDRVTIFVDENGKILEARLG